jgi:integrase
MFAFSFFSSGLNTADIARLRYSNIVDNELEINREKTKREQVSERKIHIPVTKSLKAIIDKNGNKVIGDSFIFPILRDQQTEQQQYLKTKLFTKRLNKYIRQIASAVGIKDRISSYSARHSWATIAKNSGRSVEFIGEQLGHASIATTMRYLSSFEKSARVEAAEEMETLINTSAS